MFYLDLDELEGLHKRLRLFSHNSANWFSFRDEDHAHFPQRKTAGNVRERITEFLGPKGITLHTGSRIKLLTNVRTLGYVFNPISFYFCFDSDGRAVCAIAEVSNTYGEMKLYLLDEGCLENDTFKLRVTKHFYVSPFSDLDTEFDFIFRIPSSGMSMRVDDYKKGKRVLLSALTGKREPLSDINLLRYALRFPLITVRIIALIHWQALLLRLKGLHYSNKTERMDLQKDIVKTTTLS